MKESGKEDYIFLTIELLSDVVEDVECVEKMQTIPLPTHPQFCQGSPDGPLLVSDHYLGLTSHRPEESLHDLAVGLFGVLQSGHQSQRNHPFGGACG